MERTNWEQKIIEMALEGKSDFEISNKLNIELNIVRRYITSLGRLNHPNYDIDTYNKIQMEKNLAQKGIIDKDLLEEIVNLVQNGFTFLEIACLTEHQEKDIRKYVSYLKEHPIYKDEEMYHQILKKEEKNEKEESALFHRLQLMESNGVKLEKYSSSKLLVRYQKIKKIHQMVFAFLKNNRNITAKDLANQFNLTTENVINILSGKEEKEVVLLLMSEETYQEMLKKRANEVKEIIQKFNRSAKITKTNELEMLKIQKLDSQMFFWIKFILTFRITIEDFASLVKIEDVELLKKSILKNAYIYGDTYTNALIYLWNYYVIYFEKECHENFKDAKKYLFALNIQQNQKQEEYKKMLKKINDQDAMEILKSKKNLYTLSDEEKHTMIEFYLKYALSTTSIPYDYQTLFKNANKKELEEIEALMSYNQYKNKEVLNAKKRI